VQIRIGLPSRSAREEILRILLKPMIQGGHVESPAVAEEVRGVDR